MKFHEIVQKYSWEQVKPALLDLYQDQLKSIDGYKYAYSILLKAQPIESETSIPSHLFQGVNSKP